MTLSILALVWQVIEVGHGPTDFWQDYIATQRFLQGLQVYAPLHCWVGHANIPAPFEYDTHPPSSILMILPFGFLPRTIAVMAWGFCSLAAYLASGLLLLRELGWRSLRATALFMVGSLFWTAFTLAQDVQNFPQVLTLLLVAAWLLERRGRSRWAGGLLGLAGLLKIWPAALLLLPLFQRRWRTALVGGLVLVGGALLALVEMGPAAYATYLGPVSTNERYWVPGEGNTSLVGAIARLLVGYRDPSLLLPALARGLSLIPVVTVGEIVAGVVLVGSLAFIVWCSRSSQHEATTLLSQGLLVTVLLLVFPLTFCWAIITVLLSCATTLLALRRLPRPPLWWQSLLVVDWLLVVSTWIVFVLPKWLLGQPGIGWAGLATLVAELPTYALLLFTGLQALLLGWNVTRYRADLAFGRDSLALKELLRW